MSSSTSSLRITRKRRSRGPPARGGSAGCRARRIAAPSSSRPLAAPPTIWHGRWRCAQGATAGLHRFSFAQLAARLAAPVLAARGIAPATLVGAEAVAARATFDARQEGELAYFDDRRRNAGLSPGAGPHAPRSGDGRRRAAGLRDLPLGGADLARLLEGFDEQFAAASATGRAALFEAAPARALPRDLAAAAAPRRADGIRRRVQPGEAN